MAAMSTAGGRVELAEEDGCQSVVSESKRVLVVDDDETMTMRETVAGALELVIYNAYFGQVLARPHASFVSTTLVPAPTDGK